MSKDQDCIKGVLRPCQCENGGQCFRGMHKAGEKCDRTVFLTKASRHRICKGCRSEKKKKGITAAGVANEGSVGKSVQHTRRAGVELNKPQLSLEPPQEEMWGQGGPDSLIALGVSPRLTPHGLYTTGSTIGSFQPMLSAESSSGSNSARGSESFPLGADANLPGDMVLPGMAPINYSNVDILDNEQ